MDKYKIGERVTHNGEEVEIVGKSDTVTPTSSYTNYLLKGDTWELWVAEEDLKPIKDKIEKIEKIDMKNYENLAVSTVLTKLNEIIDYINKKENVK